ncbi:YhcN/YlaJ family sporulation lipoprotein [Paenibacillus sp. JNUCC31]|uniref:YhcN/YlaJ family sporulation lipoprotein n=1 Tax=Paenibacillus sp. JNUCC-31 TaxID=2777983 RepID=UPI00177BAF7E|nr:YhcN/YlaJ family sporulation lipoprotein [Paenibacillus sp. JNUCC-31]QOS80869.1 YhcN/YlaJ family sporulation lipoprotein [Paenibacillus sp. JNUCC-31]
MPAAKKATAISLSLSTAIFVMVGLTGCGTNTKDNKNLHTQSVRHEVKGINRYGVESNGMDGIRAKSYRMHNVTNLKESHELAKRITEMKEVKSAKVMLSDRNAYVAVRLADGHTGKLESKMNGTHGNRANGTMRTESLNQDMGGMRVNGGNGTMSPYRTSGIAPGLNTNAATDRSHMGNDRSIYGTMGTGSYGMMRGLTNSGNARSMSDGHYGMKSDTARVDSTDDNTPEEIKSKISAKIKQYAPHVENVYVSSNPEFVQHVESYSTDIRNGKPVRGMIGSFQSMVERIFPTNAVNPNHRDGVHPDGILHRNNDGLMNR